MLVFSPLFPALSICLRIPQVLAAQTPAALRLEANAGTDATEAMACAETRFLKSADSFFRPCFQGSVLDNLTRDDPVAPPHFESEQARALT